MFTQARIKLTAYYVLIVICIISLFSIFLFNYTAQHVRDSIDEDVPTHQVQHDIADATINQLKAGIILADALVILVAALLSYWLAGITLKPIQAALSAQEQFSANASHELRTPLAVMRTENEVFLRKKQHTPEEIAMLAESNLEEIKGMSMMMENLLLLARSKEGNSSAETIKVNLSLIIQNIHKKLEPSAEAKQITLLSEFPAEAYILGNERLLEHLFFNVIQNAITYTNEGSVNVKITQGDNVQVHIIDTGIGISKKDLEHIFEPFYKADSSRTISSSGVGLGLSIVLEIVKRYKGTISIISEQNSETDKGTIVTVTFPSSSENKSA